MGGTTAAAWRGLLLVAAVVYALLAELLQYRAGWPIAWVLADLLPGVAFFVVGVVAWQRRPGNRIGPLLFATGVAWFVGTYEVVTEPTLGRLAYAFQGYYDGLLAWLVLAYPTGRLVSWSSRLAVGAFIGTLAARTLFRLAVYQPQGMYDLTNPADVDRFVADTLLREDGEAAFRFVATGIAIVVLILIIRRLGRATAAGRRVSGPILVGGLAVAAGAILEFSTGFIQPAGLEDRRFLAEAGLYITSITGALVPLGFLFGLARTRLARGGVADLVVQLGDPARAPSLRDVLARALGDPSLAIAYVVPGSDDFIDVDGRRIELPDSASKDRAVTWLEHRGQAVAALIHDPVLVEERELVTSVAAAARMALDNERLQAEVRAQLDEVQASRSRIVAAGDAERRRIERDLHDGAQQRLVTLALALEMARNRIQAGDEELHELLERAGVELDSALTELRELARGVHPSLLVEAGLGPALESLADRAPMPVRVTLSLGTRCARPGAEATAYFVVSEALANAFKHAGASAIEVAAIDDEGTLRVSVQDDGAGGADPTRGSGLVGLADRVAAVGGRLSVESPPGRGTMVTAEIPCA